MKALIDTTEKTIKLEGKVEFKKLIEFVEKNKLEDYTILPDVITEKEIQYYPYYPHYPYTPPYRILIDSTPVPYSTPTPFFTNDNIIGTSVNIESSFLTTI